MKTNPKMMKSGFARLLSLCAVLVMTPPLLAAAPSQARAAAKYAAIVIDAYTGRTLFARSADAPRFPASLTKIMTLYILFDYLRDKRLSYDTKFYVTPNAAAQPPSKLGLKAGTTVRVKDLIQALVTKSANDAATVVAENIGGTEDNFARLMTRKAQALGMTRTVFKNASGLPHAGQRTTARDMATLGLRIQRDHPRYYRFFKTRYFSYGGKRHKNHNSLLFTYHGTDGIKTGYIRASGYNLVASVRRNNRHVIAVVMGGKTGKRRDAHMRNLLNRHLPLAVARRKPAPAPTAQPTFRMAQNTPPKQPAPAARRPARSFPPPARLAPPQPEPQELRPRGPYHVQIGAFSSRDSARTRLAEVLQKAGHLLRGHKPVTIPVATTTGRTIYRARFDNFSKNGAQSACRQLKQRSIECTPMRAL